MISSQSLRSFAHVSARSAEQYVAWLGEVHEARLQDLAAWLRDRGGPLAEMDATAVSLVTLWQWVVGEIEAGLPRVSGNVRPSTATFLRSSGDAEHPHVRAAVEPVEHYVFEVLRKEVPAAEWGLHPSSGPNKSSYQEPGVLLPGARFVRVVEFVQRRADGAARGGKQAREPDRLLSEMELCGWVRPLTEVRGSSVLAPLLDLPRVRADDPVRRVPLAVGADAVDDGRWSAADVGAVLAIGPVFLADSTGWSPLDEDLVARRLGEAGWRTGGGGLITASVVGTDGAQLVWGDEQVLLEVNASGGRARFLTLDILRVTDAEWDVVHAGLESLAAELGGFLGIPGEQS